MMMFFFIAIVLLLECNSANWSESKWICSTGPTLCRYVHVAAVDHNGHDITSSLGKGHFRVTVHHTDMDGKVNNPLVLH